MNIEATSGSTGEDTHPEVGPGWQVRFWSIWIGQALSLVGSALTQFVLLWWITETTGSTSALALAGLMALLPQALLAPLGGTLADRWSRRALMIIADSVSAVCMLIIIWLFASEQIQIWHAYVLMFIRSSMQAFQQPASAASTAMLVPRAWLPRVAGLNQMVQGIMTVAAAPLGALALAFLPLQGALAIDVFTAVLAIVPLLIFAIPQPRRAPEAQGSLWADLRAGVRFVASNRPLLLLYGLVALVVMTILPTFTLTPLLVKEHFGGDVNAVALMEGLSGVGIIVGGLLITVFNPFKRKITTLLVSFAVSCAMVALTAAVPGDLYWLAVVWWVASGITFATGNAPLMALLQERVPNELQGRTFSLLNMTMGLAGPIGLAVAAAIGETLGVRGVFIIGGTLAALVCVLGFAVPRLMRIEEEPMRMAG
jgi:DHA3 family macrolide efflux protein-like MFS transporter